MNRPTPHEAMVIVARQILANATENVEWEDYPDIGQYDFDRIVSYAKLMAPFPEKFAEALDVLERRAVSPMSDRGALYEVTEGNPPAVVVGDDYMLSMVEPENLSESDSCACVPCEGATMSDLLWKMDPNQPDGLIGAIRNAGVAETRAQEVALVDAIRAFLTPVMFVEMVK